MKKVFISLLLVILGTSVMAQQKIQLRSADRAECVKSDMNSLKASFSFSTIEAEDYSSDRGTFSWLSLPNTVLGGNVGDPQIPVINELIAVPFGAQPRIEITSYSSTDYNLADYGMKTLVPRQLPVRKNQDPDEVPFVMNEAAYQAHGFRSEPMATVSVGGTMRGVQLGTMTIEPVSYDPANNTIRVFNNIEVEVHFDGADAQATEDMLLKTYSPAFEPVYAQLFNERAVRDAYTDHPDLYNTPVRMLVICYSGFQGNSALNSWLEWKLQKGYYVDIFYTDETGTSATNIKSFIQTKYNASVSAGNAYTYLIVIGDTGQVPQYMTKTIDSSIGQCASDLGYAAVNFTTSSTSNYFPDMYYSRISVENTTQLTSYLNKVLTYEKFEFTDGGNYLNNVLLVGGWDSNWTSRVAKPTINYGSNNYFNTSNTTYGGFSGGTINAVVSTSSSQGYSGSNNGVYNGINNGACLVNYTAHGDKQEWQVPQFTAAQAATLTNTGKYFFCIGNCCLTGNFNNTTTTYSPGSTIGTTASFGETMMRVPNAGAIAYVGCSPYSYWYEDFYWAVGAHSYSAGNAPSVSGSTKGVYDVMFMDSYWNSASALLYLGNLAVQQAVTNNNTNSGISGSGEGGDCNNSAHYYFQFYHTFGDGSVMPYITKPEANTVSHANTINIGATTFTVSAVAGSYVAITKDNVILGVAEVPSSGTANVSISGLTSAGDVKIVVTRQQYQPYITTIQAISNDGPYISLDSYTPNIALIGETTNLSMTFKNVGTAATSGTTTVTLSSSDANLVVDQGTKTFSALAANATTTVSGFQFHFKSTATVGFNYTLHYTATNGNNTWEGDLTVTANQFYTVTVASNNNDHGTVSGGGQYDYGASCTVTATPADGYMFTNWTRNGNVVSTDAAYTFTVSENISLVANFASGVMIGDGSSSTSEYLPSYNYYNYTLSEQIYTSAELGGTGIITSIAFYNEGAEKTRTYDFYMKATTKSTFTGKTDWITVSAGDKVFSGSVTMAANEWTTITLSTPFVYDGTSNVVLVADDNTGSYTSSPHMACRVFTATSQALYYYDDNNNFNPLSPPTSSGTYNSVLSVKNQIILTKEAISTEPVTIKVSANPEQAATVTGGGEYTFGETCTVTATPNANYTFTGWTENGNTVSSELSFSFTATSDRDLVANFIQAIEIGTGTSTHNYLPTYNYYNYSMTEQIYTADEIGVAGTINSIAFYNEGAEKTRTLDFYLKATDKESFSSKTDWVTVASSDKVFSGEVTLAANAWTFINFTAPFEYDGNSNLVLVVDDNSGAYTSSPHLACSVYNANGTQSIYIYSDGTNYNPSSPTTSQSSNYATLSVKNHLLMGITVNTGTQYTITATANPTEGGTITGAGTYYENGTCRLTATANTDYAFVNWTKDGAVVSTNTTYSFTVTEDADYVANFNYVKEYNVKIMPNDPDYGSVAFGRNRETLTYDFEDGWQGWTTFQGSTTSPHSWMHNTEYVAYDSNGDQIVPECHDSSSGMMLSESYISASTSGGGDAQAVTPDNYLVSPQFRLGGSFTFYAASRMSNYPAEKFSVLVSESGNTSASSFTHTELTVTLSDNSWNEYTIDLSAYSGMGYVAIRHYDCNDQHLLYIDDVTIVEGEVTDGSVTATYVHGTSCTVTATPNEGFYFANWTENGNVVSSDASYTFTVTSDHDLTANFQDTPPTVEQTVDLVQGWNWFVPTVDITLEELEAALGTNGISIMSQNSGSVTYDDGDDEWTGHLTELVPGDMYIIQVNGDVEFTLNGNPMSTTPVTITINEGYNWFGFTGDEVNINTALSGFNAVDGDCIMAFGDESSTSYDGDDEEWTGHLTTLKPGHGYIYISKDPTPKQLTFQGK
jgi:gingipain K